MEIHSGFPPRQRRQESYSEIQVYCGFYVVAGTRNVAVLWDSDIDDSSLRMGDHESIHDWLKHVPDRLLSAEAGHRNGNRH